MAFVRRNGHEVHLFHEIFTFTLRQRVCVCVCVFYTSWGKHLPAVDREVSDDLEGRGDIGGFRFVGSMKRSREQTRTKIFLFLKVLK